MVMTSFVSLFTGLTAPPCSMTLGISDFSNLKNTKKKNIWPKTAHLVCSCFINNALLCAFYLQMFPPGGASTLKGFTAPAFGAAATTGASSADRHQFRAGQSQHGEEDAGSGANPMLPVFMVDGPTPPVRPVRHVQHASQWAESKTTVAPGLIVRSTTATVSTSQWSEYSTTLTEGLFQGQSSSTQFQTVRNSTTQSTTGAASNPTLMSSAQYLDDLQVQKKGER